MTRWAGIVTVTGGTKVVTCPGKQTWPWTKLADGRSPIMYGVEPALDEARDCGAVPAVVVTGASVGGLANPGGIGDGGVVGRVAGGVGGAGVVAGGNCSSAGSKSASSAAATGPDAKAAESATKARSHARMGHSLSATRRIRHRTVEVTSASTAGRV